MQNNIHHLDKTRQIEKIYARYDEAVRHNLLPFTASLTPDDYSLLDDIEFLLKHAPSRQYTHEYLREFMAQISKELL